MLSRRDFIISGSVGATLLAFGSTKLLSPALALESAEGSVMAPAAFVALADQLSGQIGVNQELVGYLYARLTPVLAGLDALVGQLSAAMPRIAEITDPAERLQALAEQSPDLRQLFLRMNTALYLGTVDNVDGHRECIGFESAAAYQAVADFVQPPSYCTGSPNFWVNPPASNNNKETATHV